MFWLVNTHPEGLCTNSCLYALITHRSRHNIMEQLIWLKSNLLPVKCWWFRCLSTHQTLILMMTNLNNLILLMNPNMGADPNEI